MNRTHSTGLTTAHWILVVPILAFCAIRPIPTLAGPPDRYEPVDLRALQDAFVELADDVRPSVVAIRTYTVHDSRVAERGFITSPLNQGSGFVIDPNGYIATNQHVVAGAGAISVILDTGQTYNATVRQVDRRSDLAVLKIDAKDLRPVRRGDAGKVKVGQWAFACGNPFGLANRGGQSSVTVGVVSALAREMTDQLSVNEQLRYYGNLIETSAAINPGNSGGPLFNIDHEVIGMITAIETSTGVNEGAGFAIPINRNTWHILQTLKDGQVVRYGFMGVNVDDVPQPRSRVVAHTRAHRGAKITGINPSNGPAAKAGLRRDDIVIEIDGRTVQNSDHLVRLIQYSPVGTEVEITYLRRGVKRKTTVTLGDRHDLLGLARRD